MTHLSKTLRACLLVVVLSLLRIPVQAQAIKAPQAAPVQFTGQIAAVQASKEGKPLTFLMTTHANKQVDVRLNAHTRLAPHSAEAQVEGLAANDYVIVLAHRSSHAWVANRVDFDVRAFTLSPSVSVNGTVVQASPNGKSFTMTLDSGDMRVVQLNAKTRYLINGAAIAGVVALGKGDLVQVTMQRPKKSWIALVVNLRTSVPQIRR